MADPSIAETTKPYLDYLDKEMTIQGILSAFCVAAGAAAFDRILGAGSGASDLVEHLRCASSSYVLAAIASLMGAALFFYLQRSDLAWLHGIISFATTCEMRDLRTPRDSYSITEGLDFGNSWSLWYRYKVGLSCLAISVVEALLALVFAINDFAWASGVRWLIAGAPFLVVGIFDWLVLIRLRTQDERRVNIREAKKCGRPSKTASKTK
ncbi:MAG TPA: hypothetical protein VKZ53_09705 [Candidatus Angelobacter sp.]|nr:hypothetical protein [Candidatus Angelobacter sp.]